MKKQLPYLIGIIALFALLAFWMRGCKNKAQKTSTLVSFKKDQKTPYGTYVFYRSLQRFFPHAQVKTHNNDIISNELITDTSTGSLFVSIGGWFAANDYQADELMYFVERGNTVFISAFYVSRSLLELIDARATTSDMRSFPFGDQGPDRMESSLDSIPFEKNYIAEYPGVALEGFFARTNKHTTRILGRGKNGRANFVQLSAGKGALFIHLSPLSFSNYFMLYQNNIQYFNQVFSLVPENTRTVIWNEYYVKERSSGRKNNWFGAVMKEPAFRSGILLALALLLIFALLEMRRRQRLIPVIERPKNDSLDFVRTMGLLYYEKRDNMNLAQKMSTYFQEHLRNKYPIFSKELNPEYIHEVSDKSGIDIHLVTTIVNQINKINSEGIITDEELIIFQSNIEEFYNTL